MTFRPGSTPFRKVWNVIKKHGYTLEHNGANCGHSWKLFNPDGVMVYSFAYDPRKKKSPIPSVVLRNIPKEHWT